MKLNLLVIALLLFCCKTIAQCPAGEVEVTITIQTDDYGEEGYWELTPLGNTCGSGAIFSGGNALIGCMGGQQSGLNGGYPDNQLINEGPWCVTTGTDLEIIYTDDYADGGFTFTVYIDGYPMYAGLTGLGDATGNRFAFSATAPPPNDASCVRIKNPTYEPFGGVILKAWIQNRGTDTLNSFDLHYSIDSGPAQVSSFSSQGIASFDSTLIEHLIPWANSAQGIFEISMWTSNPNGIADINTSNDSSSKNINTGPGIPNIIDAYIGNPPTFTVIASSNDSISVPRDLDFHPILTRYELWVLLKSTENIGGKTVKISNAGKINQTSLLQKDQNAWHFMSLPTAIAFSENENFATSPGVYDANHSGGSPFTGPSLWNSDPAVYAQPSGGNGSHIDMLHESPHSMGICKDEENAFWLFDGDNQDIVYYDFKKDHGPGNNDHSDGIVRRFSGLGIACDPTHEVPSHLVLDKANGMLFFADTDNDRILKLDINTGTFAGNLNPNEGVAEYTNWTNAALTVFADSGLITPSGIDMIEERIIVSDYATGDIIIYGNNGTTGTELGRIVTGTPGVMGIKIGPDGKIWYVNGINNEVVRIDESTVSVNENNSNNFSLYPNPATSNLNIYLQNIVEDATIKIFDSKGSLVHQENMNNSKDLKLDVSEFTSGIYTLSILSTSGISYKKFVKK
jgi:hypothetical protein